MGKTGEIGDHPRQCREESGRDHLVRIYERARNIVLRLVGVGHHQIAQMRPGNPDPAACQANAHRHQGK